MEQDGTGSEVVKFAYKGAKTVKKAGSFTVKSVKATAKTSSAIYKAGKSRHTRLQAIKNEISNIENMSDQLRQLESDLHNIENKIHHKAAAIEKLLTNKTKEEIEELKELKEEIHHLKEQRKNLDNNINKLTENISSKSNNVAVIKKSLKPHPIKTTVKISYKVAKKTIKASAKGIKNVDDKLNPLKKPINKNDVADTGVESLRLGYSTYKKTKDTVKTARNVASTTVKTVKTTAKVVRYTFKFVYEVAAQAVAIIINPIFLVMAAVVLIIIMFASMLLLIVGGDNSNKVGMTTGEGLGEGDTVVAEQYKKAEEYFNKALDDRKNDFTGIIDNMYYNHSDREHSHLVYCERVKPNHHIFDKDFADDNRKYAIKNTWDYQIDKEDMIAIAYVYLELKENDDNQTYLQIYDVEFKQDTFTELIQKTVPISYVILDGQECPYHNCTRDPNLYRQWQENEERHNQAYASFDPYWDAYRGDITVDEWWNRFGWLMNGNYPYFDNNGEDYRDYISSMCDHYRREADRLKNEYENSEVCTHQHRLHNVGIAFWTKDELMDELGFDETYKYWVELTKQGFKDNPDIP